MRCNDANMAGNVIGSAFGKVLDNPNPGIKVGSKGTKLAEYCDDAPQCCKISLRLWDTTEETTASSYDISDALQRTWQMCGRLGGCAAVTNNRSVVVHYHNEWV